MEKVGTDQKDDHNESHHHMYKESVDNESRFDLPELPKDLRETHRWGPGGTLDHPIPPNGHHHMYAKLYSGFDSGGVSNSPAGVPAATVNFGQMPNGAIGVLVENISHGHNQDGSVDLSGWKGAVIAHWPNGTTSDGTYRIYYDNSSAKQKTDEAREFLIINLRLRVGTLRQWAVTGTNLTASQSESPANITIIETVRPGTQEKITEINIHVLGDVTVEGHGKEDRGPKVWWDPGPNWPFVF